MANIKVNKEGLEKVEKAQNALFEKYKPNKPKPTNIGANKISHFLYSFWEINKVNIPTKTKIAEGKENQRVKARPVPKIKSFFQS